jgi:hypothetical protein
MLQGLRRVRHVSQISQSCILQKSPRHHQLMVRSRLMARPQAVRYAIPAFSMGPAATRNRELRLGNSIWRTDAAVSRDT